MMKLFEFCRRARETLKATIKVFFLPQHLVVPHIEWKKSRDPGGETVSLMLYYYARILYELAELNETRVARELIDFVERIARRLLKPDSPTPRFHIPLGKLSLGKTLEQPADRLYEAKFYSLRGGGNRLDFQGMIGKESYYLPASMLSLLQFCIDNLDDTELSQLARGLDRLHHYYRVRGNFWEGTSLTEGPAFALSQGETPDSELTADTD